ncbi:synaptojanin, putative [Entamoeba invadens IP1]|uniref:Synaptojanin, putative n=1 Tax=Entamoeba invadens IP1 TaxID=370355 RepID=A0A0A1UG58_ENTIV|nr:synaptojanin, putative [Entamoeba invadens IP1]ELP94442.1 synaptojanin, putative [Entamoeba invadens IP1]|eukprot:XP_004261213.1 synaptojanin, putative [Entamoeba invadens IP1]
MEKKIELLTKKTSEQTWRSLTPKALDSAEKKHSQTPKILIGSKSIGISPPPSNTKKETIQATHVLWKPSVTRPREMYNAVLGDDDEGEPIYASTRVSPSKSATPRNFLVRSKSSKNYFEKKTPEIIEEKGSSQSLSESSRADSINGKKTYKSDSDPQSTKHFHMNSFIKLEFEPKQGKRCERLLDASLLSETREDLKLFLEDVEKWKTANLLEHLNYYGRVRPIKVSCITWNIEEKGINVITLEGMMNSVQKDIDIVVLGLQNYKGDIIEMGNAILPIFERKGITMQLGDLMQIDSIGVVILTKTSLPIKNKGIGFTSFEDGKRHKSLKGCVGVRLELFDSSMCFLCVLGTNNGMEDPLKKIDEGIKKMTFTGRLGQKKMEYTLDTHDIVFVMGDFKSEVIGMEYDDVLKNIVSQELEELRKKDNLVKNLCMKEYFGGYEEFCIDFDPTYQIKSGLTSKFITNPYTEKKPGWPDRVIFKTIKRHYVEVLKYTSFDLFVSQHKPVICSASLYLQEFDKKKKAEVMSYLNKLEKCYTKYAKVHKMQ